MDRREFLKQSGMLVVGFSLSGPLTQALGAAPAKSMNKEEVDAWLAIARDGTVTVYSGKVDLGTGTKTALAQMVAEELDVPFVKINMVMGDTATTIDQGQTAGSLTIPVGGTQLRRAAATARQALLEQAAKKLGAAPGELTVQDGVVSVRGDAARSVSYGELVSAGGLMTRVDPKVPLKNPAEHKLVGKSIPRVDIPAKVTGEFTYMHDFRVPGMLHARVIRPAAIGAKLVSYDEASVRDIPGFVKVVRKQDFLAVVARNEWAAVQAARRLKVNWSQWQGLPDQKRVYDEWRKLPVAYEHTPLKVGDAGKALGQAAKKLKATYEFAIQSHASMGPACAVADFRDGRCTIWSPSQATHSLQSEVASVLGVQKANVRLMYLDGSGCYGRNGHEDCTADAALVSMLAGAPVRVQWMREDELGWDPKSPPTVVDLEGGLDANGNVTAWRSEFFIAQRVGTLDDFPLLAATSSGVPRKGNYTGFLDNNAEPPYAFPNALTEVRRVNNNGLRTSHLRTPGRMQNTFANEAFIDELAAAAGADPLRFRLKYLTDPRGQTALASAARLAHWDTRPSPNPGRGSGDIARGRGIAYVKYNNKITYVGLVAEVEVNRKTGKIRVTRAWCSHDCGQVINPDGTINQIEGGIVQTISRTLLEEVRFDRSRVTSTDWNSYPILRFSDVPEIHVELINRPEETPWGAGEMSATVVPAAISNAVYDAIGVRLRSVPFTPDKVLEQMRLQRA
ncbi:MAG: molybdopterin-dependent oxidoreductase [Burkholderiales bacterium]|nr:molybdopterin-dependent oxidoreductase [Burkholderiales bacterium]